MKKNRISTKADWLLLCFLVFTSLFFLMKPLMQKAEAGSLFVDIQVDGKSVEKLDLEKDGLFEFQSAYGKNIVEIKDGRVHMYEADCKDQLCVHQGYIFFSGQMIVCLPNHFVVEVKDKDTTQTEIDGFTR